MDGEIRMEKGRCAGGDSEVRAKHSGDNAK